MITEIIRGIVVTLGAIVIGYGSIALVIWLDRRKRG